MKANYDEFVKNRLKEVGKRGNYTIIINEILDGYYNLSCIEESVLIGILRHKNSWNLRMNYICKTRRLSISTVKRTLLSLESKGFLTISRIVGRVSKYEVASPDVWAKSEFFDSKVIEENEDNLALCEPTAVGEPSSERAGGQLLESYGVAHKELPNNTNTNNTNNINTIISNGFKTQCDEVVKLWNETCSKLPKVLKLNDKRKKQISGILKEYTLEDCKTVFAFVNKSPHHIGMNSSGWVADIEFVTKSSFFLKTLERALKEAPNTQYNEQLLSLLAKLNLTTRFSGSVKLFASHWPNLDDFCNFANSKLDYLAKLNKETPEESTRFLGNAIAKELGL